MRTTLIYLAFSIISLNFFIYPHDNKSVALLISSNVYSGIDSSIQQFKFDLENEGYSVIVKSSSMGTPEETRAYLQDLYQTVSPKLVGAILIGDIPYAYQSFPVEDTISQRVPTDYICISYQFYSDLDGIFEKTNPKYPDYYSSHTGHIFPEIWISVLPLYHNNINESIIRLNSYFKKNHEFRTGRTNLQNGFLYIDEFLNASDQREYDNLLNTFTAGEYS